MLNVEHSQLLKDCEFQVLEVGNVDCQLIEVHGVSHHFLVLFIEASDEPVQNILLVLDLHVKLDVAKDESQR